MRKFISSLLCLLMISGLFMLPAYAEGSSEAVSGPVTVAEPVAVTEPEPAAPIAAEPAAIPEPEPEPATETEIETETAAETAIETETETAAETTETAAETEITEITETTETTETAAETETVSETETETADETETDETVEEDEVIEAYAFDGATAKISSGTDSRIAQMLSGIDGQNFEGTGRTASEVKSLIRYFMYDSAFAAVSGGYFPYLNSDPDTFEVTDGVYTEAVWGSRGCWAYSAFVSMVIYGTQGAEDNEIRGKAYHTASSIETLLQTYGQAGDHIRVGDTHSLTLISANNSGFYCMDFNTDHIVLHYWDYAEFITRFGSEKIWLYDANAATNVRQADEPEEDPIVTGWIELNDKKYYVLSDGSYAKGWKTIGGHEYYFNANGSMRRNSWVLTGTTWYYMLDNGRLAEKCWVTDGDYTYYMRSGGRMATGWLLLDGDYYFFGSNGVQKLGWVKSGVWYYMDPQNNGVMAEADFYKIDGNTYYMKNGGRMATGWLLLDGDYYYFGSNGAQKLGWVKSGVWYYMDPENNGIMAEADFYEIGGYIYYMKDSGRMATGWVLVDGEYYYFAGSGIMKTGWVKSGSSWYFMAEDGTMADGEWIHDGTGDYYMRAGGRLATGWQLINNEYYYFTSGGVQKFGWVKSGSAWYYMDPANNGVMAASETMNIDSVSYTFAASGKMV